MCGIKWPIKPFYNICVTVTLRNSISLKLFFIQAEKFLNIQNIKRYNTEETEEIIFSYNN